MELAFDTKEIRTVCENETQAITVYGNAIAEALKRRLADLRAAKSIEDLVVGRPRFVDNSEHMLIDLCGGQRVIIKANHPENPLTRDGKIEWAKVSRVKIVRIERDVV